jgi:hypothetical protein
VPTERVTVTLPVELIAGIDQFETNRSRFVAEAVAHEVARRRREALRASLAAPHPEALGVAEEGLAAWGCGLDEGDDGLVDASAGTAVRWIDGTGWVPR